MLKRGHLYKLTYGNLRSDTGYMFISPDTDIPIHKIRNHRIYGCRCLFHVNLIGKASVNGTIGFYHLKRIEKPSKEEDLREIEENMSVCGLSYDRKLNRINNSCLPIAALSSSQDI